MIKAYLDQRKIARIPVNISLYGPEFGFRRISLPRLPDHELISAIVWESKTLFPFDISGCIIDYQITGKYLKDGSERYYINVTAASREIIDYLYDKFDQASLKIGQVNFLPLALSRIPYPQTQYSSELRHIILYLGQHNGYALFVHKGSLEFYQEFITQPSGADKENPLIENLPALSNELDSFLDIYIAQSGNEALEGIIVCGHYGGNEETVQSLSKATGRPCQSLTSTGLTKKIAGNLSLWQINDAIASVMTALSPPDRHSLIPVDFRTQYEKHKLAGRAALIGGISIAAMGIIQIATINRANILDQQYHQITKNIGRIENSEGFRDHQFLLNQLQRQQDLLFKKNPNHKAYANLLLKELSLTIPNNITLTSIHIGQQKNKYVLTLDGYVQVKDFSPEILLAGYVDILGKSPLIDNVEVVTHNKRLDQHQANLSFQLRMDTQV